MTRYYDVTAVSIDATNLAAPKMSAPRTERLDTQTNSLIKGLVGAWQIADQYEAFWNRLNDSDESKSRQCTHADQRVVVLNVVEVL